MVANKSFSLLELLRNAGIDQAEFLRQGLEVLIQQLMEAEVRQQIGAEPYERTEGQTNSLSGGLPRSFPTKLGTLELRIPKLRRGSYQPSFLPPRRRSRRPSSKGSRKPMCWASRRGRWTSWWKPWGWAASGRARFPASPPNSTRSSAPSGNDRSRERIPMARHSARRQVP